MKDSRKDILWRVYLVYFSFAAFALLIIGRLIHIQFVEGDIWKEKAKEMMFTYETVKEVRGSILASDGSILATSIPIFDLRMDFGTGFYNEEYFSENVDSLANALSKLFRDRSRSEYKSMLLHGWNDRDRFMLVKKNVTYAQLKKAREFPIYRLGKFRGGLVAVEKSRRELPFRDLAARTIGFEREGHKVGLEGGFSHYLNGVSGKRLVRKLSNGAWMPVNSKDDIEPKDGNDIITTLDVTIQDVAEDALYRNLKDNEAECGCVILMEVQTGYVRAIANLTRKADGEYEEDMNWAIADAAEPGSTFKLASMIVAIDDGLVDLTDTVDTQGGAKSYCNQTMRDSHHGGYGRISAKKAFELSSNVGISKLIYNAYKDKPEKFIEGLYRLGLDKPLQLDLPGEIPPFVKDVKHKNWTDCYSLAWMSVGYELQITPIQTLSVYNAVANNGKLVKPLFVKEIRNSGRVVKTFAPQVLKKSICSVTTLAKVKEMLEGVVTEGTAKALCNELYKVAGKTGTAQIHQTGKGFNKENYKATFVGYFPADNPRYSCIVVINNPSKGAYYGGAVAGPVFREIANKVYATALDIHPVKKSAVPSTEEAKLLAGNRYDIEVIYKDLGYKLPDVDQTSLWVEEHNDSTGTRYEARMLAPGVVPDVKGMGAKDAIYLMEKCGLKVKVSGKGIIKSQSLQPGSPVPAKGTVNLQLAAM